MSSALLVIVASLVLLAAFSMNLLSAVRAYVNGEALWSKSQKEAVLRLAQYAHTRQESDFLSYRQALRVPLGDRAARVELDKTEAFDRAAARRGLMEGDNHSADVDRMIWLYRNFHSYRHFKTAIEIWARGDALIQRLMEQGDALHDQIRAGALNDQAAERLMPVIYGINAELTPLEDRFSQTLGVAAREIQSLLLQVMIVVGALLILGGMATWESLLYRLKDSESKYYHLLDTASEAIFLADGETGRILESNRMFEVLTGLSARDLIGSPQPLLPISGPVLDAWQSLVSSLHRRSAEMRLRRAEGSVIPVEVSGNRTIINGRVVVQIIVRDLTERKETEEALRSAHERTLEANRVKDQFLTNMSREIRTPLNGTIGLVSLLLNTQLNEEQHEYAALAKDSAETLRHVINDVVDFSKIAAGRLAIDEALFDVRRLADHVINPLRLRSEGKGLQLRSSVDASVPAAIIGDEARLRQILTNLVRNALKSTKHGSIDLNIRLDIGEPAKLRFEVRDTGEGISPEVHDQLLEVLSRDGASGTSGLGSTGLGLAVSQQLVGLMGSELALQSDSGRGNTFWFELPLKENESGERAKGPGAAPQQI